MSSKFKCPPHPIYRADYALTIGMMLNLSKEERERELDIGVTKAYKEIHEKPELAHLKTETQDPSFYFYRGYAESVQRVEIAESGHNLIRVDSDQFDETVSAKTIEQLKGEDIKLPFPAFSIDLTNCKWASIYDVCNVSHFRGQLVLRLENSKDDWFLMMFAHGLTIKQTMLDSKKLIHEDINSEDITFKLLSIIMYCTTFKKERNRVDIREVKARNTTGIPKYRTSVVKLIQPEYALFGKAGGKRGKGIQLHIRRGHWRSQAYGKRTLDLRKPMFISAVWIGQGREQQIRVASV